MAVLCSTACLHAMLVMLVLCCVQARGLQSSVLVMRACRVSCVLCQPGLVRQHVRGPGRQADGSCGCDCVHAQVQPSLLERTRRIKTRLVALHKVTETVMHTVLID